MKQVFAPGCALMIYKPESGKKVLKYLSENLNDIEMYLTCCQHEPSLPKNTQIINVCAGCDRRYRSLYEGISTISLWEILAESKFFVFPDYNGKEMTIHDPCPVRSEARVHDSVRKLLKRMNIKVKETKNNRDKSICCGDSLHGKVSSYIVKEAMKKRALEMPCENVVVYCVSCIKAIHIGGKKPRHLIDLLFNEDSNPQVYETTEWHEELQKFINKH
ncbi:MAG: (Fe-S)-binding protein [Fusobacterium sp.]